MRPLTRVHCAQAGACSLKDPFMPSPTSQLAIAYLSPDELTLDSRNPRVHGQRHLKQLAKSIETFGFNSPILIDDNNIVIAGHGRVAAARQMELASVPTVRLSHLNEHQRRAYLIADNRLSELSSWNEQGLAEIMLELADADLDFDIAAVGFSVAEIDLMIDGIGDERPDTADILPDPGPAVCRLGDRWQLGPHVVICASALEAATYPLLMEKEKADLVASDPPFNVPILGHVSGLGKVKHREFAQAVGELSESEFIAFLERGFRNAADWSRDGSLHYWAMDWRHLHELISAARAVYDEQVNLCVWAKSNAGMGSFYRSQHELFGVWRKGKLRHTNNVELGRLPTLMRATMSCRSLRLSDCSSVSVVMTLPMPSGICGKWRRACPPRAWRSRKSSRHCRMPATRSPTT